MVKKEPKKSKENGKSKKRKGVENKRSSKKDQEPRKAIDSRSSGVLRGEEEIEAKVPEISRISYEESVLDGPFCGVPTLIQSSYGGKGNFELISPLDSGGLSHYWRNNDDLELPWYGPIRFGEKLGEFEAVSLIQSDFGNLGNLELAATELGGKNLAHFWRDSGPSFDWHGPILYS